MAVATQSSNGSAKVKFTKAEENLIRILHGGKERPEGGAAITVEEIATMLGDTRDGKKRDPQSVSSSISALKRKMKEANLDFHKFGGRDLTPKAGERGRAASGISVDDLEADLAKMVG